MPEIRQQFSTQALSSSVFVVVVVVVVACSTLSLFRTLNESPIETLDLLLMRDSPRLSLVAPTNARSCL